MFKPVMSMGISLMVLFGSGVVAQTCPDNLIKLSPNERFSLSVATATDQNTRLTWSRCALGQTFSHSSCQGQAKTFTWQAAKQQVKKLNQQGYLGFSDWRLPLIGELLSITEPACYQPAINFQIFPDTSSTFFWSASSYAADSERAWLVLFGNGYDYNYPKSHENQVRLVRGGQ